MNGWHTPPTLITIIGTLVILIVGTMIEYRPQWFKRTGLIILGILLSAAVLWLLIVMAAIVLGIW